jgi:hypothetical protein
LNDPFVRLRASDLAGRILKEAGDDREAQVRRAFELALNRAPEAAERTDATGFLAQQTDERTRRGESSASLAALTDFCQALFGLNEFIYVD